MDAVDQYAVFGNPIKHSRSPQIHAAFAEQTGQALHYRAHKVELGRFAEVASEFFRNGGRGLNITVPFKLDAFEFADELSGRARRAGAVNTLARGEDGRIYGDNTDGVGMVRDINDNLGWPVAGKRILVLGAGGAVRGILGPLLKQRPEELVVANRTLEKAEALAELFAELGPVSGQPFEALPGRQFDLIINGTSASLSGDLPPLPSHILSNEGSAYDMMYGAEPTPFMRWAAAEAAWAVSDGLGMLVEQAAESFCIWRGVRPDTRPVIELIRQSLSH
ncbi:MULTISPECIES: shikimate dehydrogenase [Spongiibacter]|jgi:shikimate dehydrogenase|uniref:shikimate dehydrogenase n=1 Tax=Spongiibacter TaxID=630749 RepID=UPI000C09D48B|nr:MULTISPECIES: shikimate dehydrogenase [Spongiibacter]MAK45360.1 shikimate dehydrogenase [Spongiibacter sp.]